MLKRLDPTHTRWKQTVIACLFLGLLGSSLVTYGNKAEKSFDPHNVQIHIEHGIEMPWGNPGFRIDISGWLPKESLSIYAVGPKGEKVGLVPVNKPLHADKDGNMVVDIDYGRKGLKQGHWVLLIAGKPGAHIIQTDLPRVEPPTASDPNWNLVFGSAKGKNK